MPYGTQLHIFQKGINPVWEDPSFTEGCQYQIKSQKFQSSKYWEDLVLAMLGEQFEAENFVVGMVLKLKPQFDKIDIWLRDSNKKQDVESVKADLLRILQIEESELDYMVFKEEKAKPQPQKTWKKGKKADGPIKRAEGEEQKQ